MVLKGWMEPQMTCESRWTLFSVKIFAVALTFSQLSTEPVPRRHPLIPLRISSM